VSVVLTQSLFYAQQTFDFSHISALTGLFDVTLAGGNAHSGVVQVTGGSNKGAVCYDAGKAGYVAIVVCKQMGYR
jgi:hypothetical protein